MRIHSDILTREVSLEGNGYLPMVEYTATIGRNVPDTHDQRDDVTGVEEESAKITLRRSAEASPEMLSELRRLLSENARRYGQDAIALTIGTSELC